MPYVSLGLTKQPITNFIEANPNNKICFLLIFKSS